MLQAKKYLIAHKEDNSLSQHQKPRLLKETENQHVDEQRYLRLNRVAT
jgi:hypothetical protein